MRLIALGVATAVLACLLTGLVNAVVDPFGVTHWVDEPGLNAYRPGMATRVRLAKAWDVMRIKPKAIALGTSRTHVAIGMSHPGWTTAPRYNLAFDGATTEEMFAHLQHAQAVTPLKLVVLGLDTWQLQENPTSVRPDFDPAMLLDPDNPWSRLRARLAEAKILFNLDTAVWSLTTLKSQRNPAPAWLAPDGQRLGPVFFRQIDNEFIDDGPRRYFLKIDQQEIDFKMPEPEEPGPHPSSIVQPPSISSFVYIQRIVRFCRQHAIDLRIFITPAHAHQAEISYLMGEIPKIEAGKRRLVGLLAQDARASSAKPYPLWDFSGFSSVTTEQLPRTLREEMRFYWDSSHFKAEVGDWVLDRLFAVFRSQRTVPNDFGRQLTPQSIEFEIQRDHVSRLAYEGQHPADIALLKSFISAARAN